MPPDPAFDTDSKRCTEYPVTPGFSAYFFQLSGIRLSYQL